MTHPELPDKLEFVSYDMRDILTLSPYFDRKMDRCGIYILRFSDGSAYVGQASDVVRRFNSHSRDWPKKLPGVLIDSIEFAPCAVESLSATEQAVIAELDETTTLRNRMITKWPGGKGDIDVAHSNAPAIRIPLDRTERTTPLQEDNDRKLARYWEYSQDPVSELFSEFAGIYLAETMSSPATIAGSLWSCTALPSTAGGHRYYTLNAGSIEVLFAYLKKSSSGAIRPWVTMNVALPEGRSAERLTISTHVCEAAPSTNFKAEQVWTWRIDLGALFDDQDDGHEELSRVFDTLESENELFDLAYQLNRRLMARRPSMWISSHNEHLASDFLSRAVGSDLSLKSEAPSN